MVGAIDSAGGLTAVARPLLAVEPIPIEVPDGTRWVLPDSTDATWAKIRFGPDGWSRLAEVLPMITDEPARVVIDNAIRDAVRDAELDPATAFDLILAGGRAAPTDLFVSAMLGFAADQLAGPYCPVAVAGDQAGSSGRNRARPGRGE